MDPKTLTEDFREFLKFLNVHGVDYLVIGGHAVAFHGYPRATNDLDVWVAVNEANAARLAIALHEFGFSISEVTPDLFLQKERLIRMGVAPNRIEIQTAIDGVLFEDCFSRRVDANLDGEAVHFIALEDLKANKRASGRNKDLADLDELP